MQAAPFVVESYQDVHAAKLAANAATGSTAPVTVSPVEARAALQTQLGKLRAAAPSNPIAAAHVPLVTHALVNFSRLDAAADVARMAQDKARHQEQSYGIDSGQVEHYVTHVYGNLDDIRGASAPTQMFGGSATPGTSKYFMKGRTFNTLVDAILHRYDPKSTNIADLAEHRIKAGQKLVERARNRQALYTATDPSTGSPLALPATQGTQPPVDYVRIHAGGDDMFVYKPYEGFFNSLYAPSFVRNSAIGRGVIRTVQGIKHGTVVFDMIHLMRVLGRQFFTTGSVNLRRSQSLLEYTPHEIQQMVRAGELTPQEAAWIAQERPTFQKLQDAGLNIGRVSDALWADTLGIIRHATEHYFGNKITAPLRVVEEFNRLVFEKATRSGMTEVAIKFYHRNLKHGLSEGEAARLAALEVNRLFGNLGRQGLLKSRSAQDLARIALFAPQWMEGTITSELHGGAQTVGAAFDLVSGRKVRAANVAKLMLTTASGMLLANQLINFATTGHSTFQNEEGHKMDAWLPGGHYGFWINPFTFLNSFYESFHRYYQDQQPRTMDDRFNATLNTLERIGKNKLSGPLRGLWTSLSGRDYRDQPLNSFRARMTEGIMSASPLPIPLSPLFERNPGEFPRLSWQGNEPGAWERQAAASMGIHLIPAQGPTDKMYALARKFRPDSTGATHEPSKYTLLRRALRNGDNPRAAEEMLRLVQSGGAKLKNMDEAMHMEGGTWQPPKFTGTKTGETDLIRSLSPTDRQTYKSALAESQRLGRIYWQVRSQSVVKLHAAQTAAQLKAAGDRAALLLPAR